ncbi:uncharacterized protein [Panulirus ornatus]|uniref:uncharacterized protein n=1 Tax=Panulirus ornatus TaxID=150431 RepID=UPI003A8BBEBB
MVTALMVAPMITAIMVGGPHGHSPHGKWPPWSQPLQQVAPMVTPFMINLLFLVNIIRILVTKMRARDTVHTHVSNTGRTLQRQQLPQQQQQEHDKHTPKHNKHSQQRQISEQRNKNERELDVWRQHSFLHQTDESNPAGGGSSRPGDLPHHTTTNPRPDHQQEGPPRQDQANHDYHTGPHHDSQEHDNNIQDHVSHKHQDCDDSGQHSYIFSHLPSNRQSRHVGSSRRQCSQETLRQKQSPPHPLKKYSVHHPQPHKVAHYQLHSRHPPHTPDRQHQRQHSVRHRRPIHNVQRYPSVGYAANRPEFNIR